MLIARAVFPTYGITALNRQLTSWRVEAVMKPQRWQEWEDVLRQQGSDGREASVDLPISRKKGKNAHISQVCYHSPWQMLRAKPCSTCLTSPNFLYPQSSSKRQRTTVPILAAKKLRSLKISLPGHSDMAKMYELGLQDPVLGWYT